MTLDPDAFAKLLVDYCLEVEAGDEVLVRSTTLATPLMLALQRAIMQRDAWALLRPELEGEQRGFLENASDRHLDLFPKLAYEESRRFDKSIGIQAPFAFGELDGIDPDSLGRLARARQDLRDNASNKRWCLTLWPTPALAQRAGLDLDEYGAFVQRALFLDQEDPVAAWRGLGAFQDTLVASVSKAREIRIEAQGTDLTMSVHKRQWVNSEGKRNMPSGEIFTGPVEESVNGVIEFDIPSSPPGVAVSGVRLVFKDGEVVESSAAEGEDYLRKALATDEGARRVGELGIGSNFGISQPTGMILLDEKIGGTVHIALGRAYPETGSKNRSAIHWDMICDLRNGGRLSVDGEALQIDGKFVI
ncbi:MAG TPA: aminopeptidase [Baekduia sp.]|nr:aminopeptidase [Baekduia sp.]